MPPFLPPSSHDPTLTDPDLLATNSQFRSFSTTSHQYSSLRIFHHAHKQSSLLPSSPAPLPLVVCIHGLGGSIAQFHPLLTTLTQMASCLAVDLPGCGRSAFTNHSWEAYTTDALVELLAVIVDEYREDGRQGVVLVAHSMGTALAARLATRQDLDVANRIVGLVAICPVAGPPSEEKVSTFRWLLWIPEWIFNLWRLWDRRGGTESVSVKRFVGEDASPELREMALRFNAQSRTPVWRRMAAGCLPSYVDGVPVGGIPGREAWESLDVPVLLVGGASDFVTKASEVDRIAEYLQSKGTSEGGGSVPTAAVPALATRGDSARSTPRIRTDFAESPASKTATSTASSTASSTSTTEPTASDPPEEPSTPQDATAATPLLVPPQPAHPPKTIKSVIIPPPASHALIYAPSTSRILACHITDFLASAVTARFSLAWQLRYLSQGGKWDVKNLEKWKGVAAVSAPIGPRTSSSSTAGKPKNIFRAMKTLREADAQHSPRQFTAAFSHLVSDVVDISKDQPVYDPRGLEAGGIHYHKFPTVSKIPPTAPEVDGFIALVDRIRAERAAETAPKSKSSSELESAGEGDEDDRVVGVHCHYGFNRTGYFIVCYLVERCGMGVNDAIEVFREARPSGIRHAHFRDRLFMRYPTARREDWNRDV